MNSRILSKKKSKICSKCEKRKSLDLFYKHSARKDGLTSQCKECTNTKNNEWYEKNKFRKAAYSKGWQLKHLYNLSQEDYKLLLKRQKNICAICKKTCPTNKKLAVDHCHETGSVRGLLCVNCNRGLGNFKNNPTLLLLAVGYLNRSENK